MSKSIFGYSEQADMAAANKGLVELRVRFQFLYFGYFLGKIRKIG